MENLAAVAPNEIPDGFTSQASPGAGAGGGQPDAASLKKLQMEEQRKAILEQALSQEALARLGRIKLVKPDKADLVEKHIVSMAMQGKLPGKINESKLIELLERGSRGSGAEGSTGEKVDRISIQRKKYAFEDESDDDNDDDLL